MFFLLNGQLCFNFFYILWSFKFKFPYFNDYSFNYLFSRNLRALYKKNDILVVISTSGNSPNIINVLKEAKKLGIFTIGFLGSKGGHAKKYCKLPLIVNSNNVARIQEAHIFLGHFILQQVENMIIKK